MNAQKTVLWIGFGLIILNLFAQWPTIRETLFTSHSPSGQGQNQGPPSPSGSGWVKYLEPWKWAPFGPYHLL